MKNKKGFTLIELLVCITILGIIMGMSIPVIRNITTKNSATKYSSYLDTVVHAAKLYIDSYGEDIFGYNESGCGYVSFEDLLDKKLIKDYNSDGITCNTKSTFVQVTKYEDSYSYKGYLGCANKHDVNNLIYTLPNNGEENVQDSITCAGVDTSTTLNISVAPSEYENFDKSILGVKININGRNGIDKNSIVKYKWVKNLDGNFLDGLQAVTFNIPTEAAQRLALENGNIITASSSEILTPVGENGKIYLLVYSDSLRDLSYRPWNYYNLNYATFGPYFVDNTSPVFAASSAVKSTTKNYNSENAKLSIDVSDDLTPENDLVMCISYDDYCTEWEKYDGNKALDPIPGFKYDGSKYKIYVSVRDLAGNIANKEFEYRAYTECTSYVLNNDWVGGECPACGTNVRVTQTSTTKDAWLRTPCTRLHEKKITCDIPSCCSSKKVVCSEWGEYGACSKTCGGGTMTRTRTCRYVSNYDNSDCGKVTDSNQLKQVAACAKINCAPKICIDNDGSNNWTDKDYFGGETVVYTFKKYECDTRSTYAFSRTCSVEYPSNFTKYCYSYTSSYVVDDVKLAIFVKVGNKAWTEHDWKNVGWSTQGKHDLYLQTRTGQNYTVESGTAYYKINK